MNFPDDSDAEVSKLFDERVRLRRKNTLLNITNMPARPAASGDRKQLENEDTNTILTRDEDMGIRQQVGNHVEDSGFQGGDVVQINKQTKKNKMLKLNDRNIDYINDEWLLGKKRTQDSSTFSLRNDRSVEKDERIESTNPLPSSSLATCHTDLSTPGCTHLSQTLVAQQPPVAVGRVPTKVVFRDRSSSDGNRREETNVKDDNALQKMQRELEELREIQGRELKMRGKLIKDMEKEVCELKMKLEERKEKEIEEIKKHYEELLVEKQNMYREIFRKKVLEYKSILDEEYRKKIVAYKERCSGVMSRVVEMLKKRKRGES